MHFEIMNITEQKNKERERGTTIEIEKQFAIFLFKNFVFINVLLNITK